MLLTGHLVLKTAFHLDAIPAVCCTFALKIRSFLVFSNGGVRGDSPLTRDFVRTKSMLARNCN